MHFWGNWAFCFVFHSFYPSFLFCFTGVIAVVIFIIFCIIAIMSRFLYQHKQAHRNSQKKEKEYPENLESSFKADIDLQNTVSECKREYFIWWTVQFPLTLPPLNSFSLALSPSLFSFWIFFLHSFFASFVFLWKRPPCTGNTENNHSASLSAQELLQLKRPVIPSYTKQDPRAHLVSAGSSWMFQSPYIYLLVFFFLWSYLSSCFYTRAGLCKVQVK